MKCANSGQIPAGINRSAVMPLLHLAQSQSGYLSSKTWWILPRSPTFRSQMWIRWWVFTPCITMIPTADAIIFQVCTDLPCALRGADEFLAKLCENIGIRVGETTPDGLFTIESVTCLAGCHHAPIFQVQGDGDIVYHEDQTPESAMKVIDELRRKAGEEAGQ